MKPNERRDYILEKVRKEKFASVDKLSSIFNVSVQSIRKDINILCKDGLLRRIYGGVEIPSTNDNLSYESRKILRYDEKRKIAQEIVKHIPNDSSIYISIGTTPEIVAQFLLEHEDLKIFTNNINVALVCSKNPSFEIVLHGGYIRNKHLDILGNDVEKFFSSYSVDFGIFGVGAISKDGSLLDFTKEEVLARQTIKQHSKKSFLIADYSKFERNAHVRGDHIKNVDAFFCDQEPPKEIVKILNDNKIELFFSKED